MQRSRYNDLEEQIALAYDLLLKQREAVMLTNKPRERARLLEEAQDIEQQLNGFIKEYTLLARSYEWLITSSVDAVITALQHPTLIHNNYDCAEIGSNAHLLAYLEISLVTVGAHYSATMRFRQKDQAADVLKGPYHISLEPTLLLASLHDPELYGNLLTSQFFGDPQLISDFAVARGIALQAELPMQVRLQFADPALHLLHWELLQDPIRRQPLALDPQLRFSRFLPGQDWSTVTLRPRGHERALAAIARPINLASYGLTDIDIAQELVCVRNGMKTLTLDILPSQAGRCSLETLSQKLRSDPGYDFVYLLAHGAFIDGMPILYLELPNGMTAPTNGLLLAELLRNLHERRPKLVVLASCESAGNGYADTLAALGPQLAQAGVPAILAMQGNLSMRSSKLFITAFFEELLNDGSVDRAVAVARNVIREHEDWWIPVLYSRLKDGHLWL